jgi:putative ABC transport system permease protein
MTPAPRSLFVRLALAAVRVAALVVPRRDRDDFTREWRAEILHRHAASTHGTDTTWSADVSLFGRSLGSWSDAAWLRRQFSRDSDLMHDVRHALRLYRRAPGTIAIVIGVLALGIGATTAVFSAVEAILLRPIPIADSSRTFLIWLKNAESSKHEISPADFLDMRDRLHEFDIVAGAEPFSRDYTEGAEPEIFAGARVTDGFFTALRVEPALGRLFTDEDYRQRRDVVLLSEGLWKRRFGGRTDMIGRTVRLDGAPFEVIGILPASFKPRVLYPDVDVWTAKTVIEDYERRARGGGYWNVVARLRPGSTLERAQQDLDGVTAQLATAFPRTNGNAAFWAQSLRSHLAGGAERPLALLGLGAVLILVLAIGSVANLQVTLLSERLQEFVVRAALGAHRGRLVRQVLAEGVVVAGIAVTLGVLLAKGLLDVIRAVSPEALDIAGHAQLNLPVLGFACGLGFLTSIVAALWPIATLLRSNVASTLPGALTSRSQLPVARGRSVLVVTQIAIAAILLVSAGLLARSFMRLMAVDAGLNPDRLVALQVFAYDRNDTAAKRSAFFAETLARIAALPGVESAGAASTVPFVKADLDIQSPVTVHGREPVPEAEAPRTYMTSATPDYFRTAGIALRSGRVFTTTDTATTTMVAVINESAARKFWPREPPVGRFIDVVDYGRKKTLQVVGVVADLRYGGLDGASRPEVFMPHAQSPTPAMTYVVRASQDPAALVNPIKKAVWSVDPLQTFYDAGAVSEMVRGSLRPRVFVLRLALVFAGVGFVLAIAGAYGAVAWTLRRRTAEFGIRMALGARAADIRRQVLSYAGRLAVVGLALGLAAALLLGRLLQRFLFEIDAADPVTLVVIAVLMLGAVFVASSVPARRATRIDPVTALRI